jgi:hypothetical protein
MTTGYTPEGYALFMTYDAENRMKSASYTDGTGSHLLLARDLKYLKTDEHKKLEDGLIEVKRMLATFIRKLRAER